MRKRREQAGRSWYESAIGFGCLVTIKGGKIALHIRLFFAMMMQTALSAATVVWLAWSLADRLETDRTKYLSGQGIDLSESLALFTGFFSRSTEKRLWQTRARSEVSGSMKRRNPRCEHQATRDIPKLTSGIFRDQSRTNVRDQVGITSGFDLVSP